MLPRERVLEVIRHGKADRIPLYAWVRVNLEKEITEAFGSVEALEDRYEFDYAHLFGGPALYPADALTALKARSGGVIEPSALLQVPLNDPNRSDTYQGIRDQVAHHKVKRGRWVYVQTPGIFECLNGVFGIENHLAYLLLFERDLHEVYRRQAEWNRAFAMNCLDLGVDMIHVSDDWGSQNTLLFSPEVWWRMIFPYHRVTCRAVKQRGGIVSLHCDGNFMPVVDGVLELGYDVVHPWQESAGMSLDVFKARYRNRLTVMGGLDIQTALGFGKLDLLEREIKRVLGMFADGGLLFCTSHFVQAHCTMTELKVALDISYRLCRDLCRH